MSQFKTVIKYDKNIQLPYDFDWRTYVALNHDLRGFSEEKAKRHYLLFGINENRSYKYEANNTNEVNEPNEIHISNLNYKILNENLNENYIYNDLWCHVHSNNPKDLLSNEQFIKLAKYFTIIFTCDYDISRNLLSEFTFLHVDNKYPNLDKKNHVLKYLMDKEYSHDLLISIAY